MNVYTSSIGEGNTLVKISACQMGEELAVFIYNENAHIGAVAVSEYDHANNRASTSIITRLGHKDDTIAQRAAYLLSNYTKKAVCVIAGIHVDKITRAEIEQIVTNSNKLVEDFIDKGCRIS